MGINFDEDSVKYVSKHVGLISVSIDYYTYTYDNHCDASANFYNLN